MATDIISPSVNVQRLAYLWQRALSRESVRQDENFFDAGGTAYSAIQLFDDIANEFGRELPPLTILQTPTLEELGSYLNDPAPPQFPSLVPMKVGAGTPVFVTHGIGGNVLELNGLVRSINIPNPIYGLQCLGFDGRSEPASRVEQMVASHVQRIREIQSHGPYVLIGYSFGGVVMFEIARQLAEKGEAVALTAMLESYPHRSQFPFSMRCRIYPQIARRHVGILRRLSWRKRYLYLTKFEERRPWSSRNEDGSQQQQAPHGWKPGPNLDKFRFNQGQAWIHCVPGYYPGVVTFVQASQRSILFCDNPKAVWAHRVAHLNVEVVPGDHFGIITTHARSTGALLGDRIGRALNQS
jgi:acetoacetyl-CoA synthetase